MAAPAEVQRAHDRAFPLIRSVRATASGSIRNFCQKNGYYFFDRIKDGLSLAEKIESGRYNSWSDIDDLYACSIVIPTAEHESRVIQNLERMFEKVEIRSRSTTKKSPDVFRFDTTRFYARLTEISAISKPAGIRDLKFEIQIPTAFEHAWATVTHDLVYKGEQIDWQKLRLAAHLKSLAEQADLLIDTFNEISPSVHQSSWPEVDSKALIVRTFIELQQSGLISPNLAPKSWRRFGDTVWDFIRSSNRNSNSLPQKVEDFLAGLEASLRNREDEALIESGSLFQLVVAYADRTYPKYLERFTIVDSEELRRIHGVANIPKPFIFNLPQEVS